MTRPELKQALARATRQGRTVVVLDGATWLRQRSGWAKQAAWLGDPCASMRFSEIGEEPPEAS